MKDPRKPDSIYDHIARINRMRLEENYSKAKKQGAFKFKKSRGANSAEMYKGK